MVLFCWIKSTRRNYDKMKLNREYISNLIGDTYKNWTNGDKILIDSPCGSGKSTFMKELVGKHKHTGFLIVVNRTNLKDQYWDDLKSNNKNFKLICYQSLAKELQRDKDYMKQYAIIIFDEFHHLLDSANYDRYTDIIYNEIINGDYSKNILIIMSATIGRFKDILKSKFSNLKIYEQTTIDYSYIDKVYMYKKSNSIIETIANDNSSSKWIIFVSNKDDGKKYENELLQHGIECKFIYSDKKKSKKIEKITKEIVEAKTFNSKVLIATSILQEGVNIEDKLTTNIVMETWTEIATIQSFSRVRVKIENPKRVNLYIRKRTKHGIIGKYNHYFKKHEFIDDFTKSVKDGKAFEFISEKYNRDVDKFFKDNYGTYYLDKDRTFKANALSFLKFFDDYGFYKRLAEGIGYDKNYQVNQVLKWFNLEDRTVIDLDGVIEEQHEETKTDLLNVWINEHIEQRLFKEQQNELIDLIGLKDTRGRLQKSIGQLNAYLEEHYKVQLTSKRVKIDKKLVTIWEIKKPD